MRRLSIFMLISLPIGIPAWALEPSMDLNAPSSSLRVQCRIAEGSPVYSVFLSDDILIDSSPLGLVTSTGDFTHHLKISEISAITKITDDYPLFHGKQSHSTYLANESVVTLENVEQQCLQVVFRVSDTGVAFCYRLTELGESESVTVTREATGFALPTKTRSWLHPLHDAKTGWEQTFPSYESHYTIDQPVGQPAPMEAGWAFPALFKVGQIGWLLISETDGNGNYCGTRLDPNSVGGLYRIAFPQEQENRGLQDPVTPTVQLPFQSPWRIIIASANLGDIVTSTLATDLAAPSQIDQPSFVKPGRAAWSWLRYDNAGAQLRRLEEYLGMAVNLNWEYMLVDADWDQILGYETVEKLSKKAQAQGVKLILWYNSNGEWNTAPFTPKDKMYIPEVRQAEFKRLKAMGIAGVKIDFFGGDKQVTMQLYMDILRDAADAGLLCNFHGATLPRGWQRTWPNLVTTEAVMGMEFCTFDQVNTDQQAQHCTVLPFTRNVVAPMDFTPMVMSRHIRDVQRVTSPAFELALAVVFESGIQHFGLAPFEAKALPDFAIEYLRAVPTAWDQTRYLTGTPGKEVVLARRKGEKWYIAGINGENQAKSITLDLSFLPDDIKGTLMTDSPLQDELINLELPQLSQPELSISLQPQGGFILIAQ